MKKKDTTYEQRFWEKVQKTDSCWLWIGGKTDGGYGMFIDGMKIVGERRAHRISYCLHHNTKISDPSAFVCHSCDNPSCVNPEHLWLGDNLSNVADRVAKGRHRADGVHREYERIGCKTTRVSEELKGKVKELRAAGRTWADISRETQLTRHICKRLWEL